MSRTHARTITYLSSIRSDHICTFVSPPGPQLLALESAEGVSAALEKARTIQTTQKTPTVRRLKRGLKSARLRNGMSLYICTFHLYLFIYLFTDRDLSLEMDNTYPSTRLLLTFILQKYTIT